MQKFMKLISSGFTKCIQIFLWQKKQNTVITLCQIKQMELAPCIFV